jgi:hypothetical protein
MISGNYLPDRLPNSNKPLSGQQTTRRVSGPSDGLHTVPAPTAPEYECEPAQNENDAGYDAYDSDQHDDQLDEQTPEEVQEKDANSNQQRANERLRPHTSYESPGLADRFKVEGGVSSLALRPIDSDRGHPGECLKTV